MHHGSQSHVSSLHRVLHITHIYMCIFINKYTYGRVWALYTQERYMGLRPLYAGMIYGSGPFIPRDAGRGIKYIYGSGPFIPWDAGRGLSTYSGLCPDTQGFGQGLYIYIHITQNMYICVCTCRV